MVKPKVTVYTLPPTTHGNEPPFLVSVVIPAHNEEDLLPYCLDSLKRQDWTGKYEIIVVNNASTDTTADVALHRGARTVFEPRKSPAYARQRGLLAAKGKIVAFIDADTMAPPGWLRDMVKYLQNNPRTVFVTGPYAYFDVGNIARVVSCVTNFFALLFDYGFRRLSKKGGPLWGSNFAGWRKTLLEAGGFNTNIKAHGGEDAIQPLHFKQKGKSGIIPHLFVLTSSRRLRNDGIWSANWAYVLNYFAILFSRRPAPAKLANFPQKLRAFPHTGR